jgi:exopolysaccharide production protein ExoZ
MDARTAFTRVLLFGVPAVMVVYGALGLEKLFTGRWANASVLAGDASYSIYLTHLFPVNALTGASPMLPAAKFVLAVAIGLAVHRLVERPLAGWVARRRTAADGAKGQIAEQRPVQTANAPLTCRS